MSIELRDVVHVQRHAKDGDDDAHLRVFPGYTCGDARSSSNGRFPRDEALEDALTRPSLALSQKSAAPVSRPAPFFCMMMQVTMYLKGRFRVWSSFKQASTIWWILLSTNLGWYWNSARHAPKTRAMRLEKRRAGWTPGAY